MNAHPNSAFVAKYAPKDLSEVVFADVHVENAIQRYASEGDVRALILYGPNGTGKSTIANLLSRKLIPRASPFDIQVLDSLRAANYPKIGKWILEDMRFGSMTGSKIRIHTGRARPFSTSHCS